MLAKPLWAKPSARRMAGRCDAWCQGTPQHVFSAPGANAPLQGLIFKALLTWGLALGVALTVPGTGSAMMACSFHALRDTLDHHSIVISYYLRA